MAHLCPIGPQFFKNDGTVAAGCKLYTRITGTTTQKTAWQDQAGTVSHDYPISLNSAGYPNTSSGLIWLNAGEEYRFRLEDALGTLIWQEDDIYGIGNSGELSSATNGTSLIGWQRTLTGATAHTLQSYLLWQELSAFEFMTTAQIVDYQSAAKTLDLSSALQAWINACATAAASDGKIVGRLPPGGGRVGTTLTVPAGVVLRGHGIQSQLSGWGASVFQITGDHVVIEDMGLFGYTNAGVPDPKAQDAISSNGVLATKNNYARIKRLYLQGWNRCIDLHYMDGSVIDDITTVNCNYGVRVYAQSVNNSITNSRLVANTGVASIHAQKNGSDQGEGLMVTNCLLASGQNAFLSDGFLSVGFYNCIADLLTEHAFDVNSVVGLTIDSPWVYSQKRCVNFQALGGGLDVDATINIGKATTAAANNHCVVVGANNNGVNIVGGNYVLSSSGTGVPIVLSGDRAIVGPVIVRNATTNADIQINGNNIRISQEAYLPNATQVVVSQIRSVASGATTTLPNPTGAQIERITISGNTGCTALNDAATWTGKIVVLVFSGTPTWTDGGNLKLSANFVATADDTLTLTSDGTNWFEIARSAN